MRLLNRRYLTHTHYSIGAGGFSQIYKAVDLMTGQLCAVKVGRNEMLHWREVHAYALLSGQKGIAKYHWNDWMAEGCVLILDGLRANLAELSAVCPFNRDTEMTSHLAVETIARIQTVHSVGLVHGDIKPENFTLGSVDDPEPTVYILDFGSSFPYLVDGTHIQDKPIECAVAGTSVYGSLRFHQGRQLSRKDDIESLAYTLLDLYIPGLPWKRMAANSDHRLADQEILQAKQEFLEEYMWIYPTHIAMLSYSQGLTFEQPPDYDLLKAMFMPLVGE